MPRRRVKVPIRTAEEKAEEQNVEVKPEAVEETPKAEEVTPTTSPADTREDISAEAESSVEQVDVQSLLKEIETLKAELEKARAEAAEYKDKYLRTAAEMENMRKRVEKRFAEEAEQEKLRFLRNILPVIDHLEMVLKHSESDPEVLRQGVEMTLQEFLRTLEREGVKRIQSVGQPFDPFIHEAVEVVETDAVPPGTVVEELQAGYMYKDKLIRPARVRVAKEPGDASR
ncbi:MAG: nucleotide exchange factor GrpE [Chloroflexi bacterium]|nr:nucleotide exchange factor GrpE [Chloroflexota bacterium]